MIFKGVESIRLLATSAAPFLIGIGLITAGVVLVNLGE